MSDIYPEHAKRAEVFEAMEAIAGFIEESEYVLARYVPCRDYHHNGGRWCWQDVHLVPVTGVERAVAEHFGIDLKKIEAERREMLDRLREANGG